MPRSKPPPSLLVGSPDEVEARFYEALRLGDIERLMAVWADDEEIVCVHADAPRAIGAAAIRAGFAAIFAAGGIPVRLEQVHRLQLIGAALHHGVERIEIPGPAGAPPVWLLTTNFFVKTAQGWRLAAHHASPGPAEPLPAPGSDTPTLLH